VDASSYFARPGPRIVEGTELIAHLIHPELFDWHGRDDAFQHLQLTGWPRVSSTKMCPRCGDALTCGPRPGGERCWCDARPRVALSNNFGDCLCPSCLDDEIKKVLTRIAE